MQSANSKGMGAVGDRSHALEVGIGNWNMRKTAVGWTVHEQKYNRCGSADSRSFI